MSTSRASSGPVPVPASIKRSRILVACQALGATGTGVLMLALAPEERGDGATLMLPIGLVALTFGLFLAYCVYRLGRPLPRALRTGLVVVESLYLAAGVVLLFATPALAFASVFALVVLVSLLGSDGGDWIAD
ncbi:hypothetical protein AB0G79_13370 [Streptomyces sp. NPDC020807]|uniref:hypothetical protein n=1 Tax=Streptomyces sp. NPDC020807 TaxID=3155119 RepID=UPI0033FD8702